jgi:hypothetical protein
MVWYADQNKNASSLHYHIASPTPRTTLASSHAFRLVFVLTLKWVSNIVRGHACGVVAADGRYPEDLLHLASLG